MTIAELLDQYLSARGLELPMSGDPALKVQEEAHELVEACHAENVDVDHIAHELADVVLAAAVVASDYGLTVEAAIAAKIEFDRGRAMREPRE